MIKKKIEIYLAYFIYSDIFIPKILYQYGAKMTSEFISDL